MNKRESFDYEPSLDALLEHIKLLPKPTFKLLNLKRYREMLQTASNLQELISKAVPTESITVEIDPVFNLGSISAEVPDLCVMHPQRFGIIISGADNFEMYPLSNGNLRFDVTFHNVIKSCYEEERS